MRNLREEVVKFHFLSGFSVTRTFATVDHMIAVPRLKVASVINLRRDVLVNFLLFLSLNEASNFDDSLLIPCDSRLQNKDFNSIHG